MSKKPRYPDVEHKTLISTRDAQAIASSRNFVTPANVFPKPWHRLPIVSFSLGAVVGLAGLFYTRSPYWLMIAALLCYWPVIWMTLLNEKAKRRFIQHWIESGNFYPDDFRYDPKIKSFQHAVRSEQQTSSKPIIYPAGKEIESNAGQYQSVQYSGNDLPDRIRPDRANKHDGNTGYNQNIFKRLLSGIHSLSSPYERFGMFVKRHYTNHRNEAANKKETK